MKMPRGTIQDWKRREEAWKRFHEWELQYEFQRIGALSLEEKFMEYERLESLYRLFSPPPLLSSKNTELKKDPHIRQIIRFHQALSPQKFSGAKRKNIP